MRCRLGIAFLATLLLDSFAQAGETGPYVEVSAGATLAKVPPKYISLLDVSIPFEDPYLSDQTNDSGPQVGWSLAVGYRFSDQFSLEASYNDLGEAKTAFNGGLWRPTVGQRNSFQAAVESTFSVKGFALTANGTVPFAKFELIGKAGLLLAEVDSRVSVHGEIRYFTIPPGLSAPVAVDFDESDSTDSLEFLLGVGFRYLFTERYALKLEYNHFFAVGDEDSTNVGYLATGLQYRF